METINWTLLTVFASALAASSILFLKEEVFISVNDVSIRGRVCDVLEEYSCERIRFGQYLGISTASFSLLMVFIHPTIPIMFQGFAGVPLFVAWVCAAAFVTFSNGHGREAGSVYLEVWAGFFLSLNIMNSSIVAFIRQRRYHEGEGEAHSPTADGLNDRQDQQEQPTASNAKDEAPPSQDQNTVDLQYSEEAVGADESL